MNFKDRLCAMNCHYRFYELENFFQSVHKLGMHYVELWSGPMHYYVDARRHEDVYKRQYTDTARYGGISDGVLLRSAGRQLLSGTAHRSCGGVMGNGSIFYTN